MEELGSPKTGKEELGSHKIGMKEELGSPKTGKEELGSPFPRDGDPLQDSQRCSITFHTPNSCPTPDPSRESRRDLDHLQELLEDTKATLRDLEVLATREDNGTRYGDVIAQALPAIHEANLEFRESLENIRRELEEHVARVEHPRVLEQREQ
ncbi:hypothetical protein WISP_00441 [Willisornis vidua]|uniref:Uncharacterized protein n=1 Tax=Willisornis vidua TaxID=1566151 RepID=A0ABQ9E1F8_9PASS|nr:hypothetical protein WISP_00441 [Willisornis vidua]